LGSRRPVECRNGQLARQAYVQPCGNFALSVCHLCSVNPCGNKSSCFAGITAIALVDLFAGIGRTLRRATLVDAARVPARCRDRTRDELIIAFNLYCKLPFGRIHMRNPLILELAGAIGRSPSAVSWKLANVARLDPSLRLDSSRILPFLLLATLLLPKTSCVTKTSTCF
jgi:hypothetical protein